MKKFLLLAVLSVASTGLASAATISALCGSADVNTFTTGVPVTSAAITCPSFSSMVGSLVPGDAIYAGTTLGTLASITGIFGQPTGTATMVFSGGGFTYAPAINLVATNAADVLGSTNTLVGIGSAATFQVTYDVTQTSAANTIGSSTGSVGVIYEYNTAIPEPATSGLLGGALLGIGLLARRRRK